MARADFALPHDIARMGELLRPRDAQPPILAPIMRQSVHQWLVEMSAADELASVGVKPRRRALFGGPPGCGKTTLAHHVAARLGLPMLVVDASALNSKWVNESGENVNRLFGGLREQADKLVLFFDEFDAIATSRGSNGGGSEREGNKVVVALLQHIDRYSGITVAATNQEKAIDSAIWRRFDIQMEIGLPGGDERFAILKQYGLPYDFDEATLEALTEATGGATPALLRGLMEGIKRNLVIAPRLSLPVDAPSVIGRVVASLEPAEGLTRPMLWSGKFGPDVAKMPWPPALPEAREAA